MEAEQPYCVGLAGDGDEIAAVEQVEEMFGIILDKQGAPRWRTAGDLFESLLEALPPDAASDAANWERFAKALARETGVDPHHITTNSPLLLPDKGFWGGFKEIWGSVMLVWIALLLVAILF